MYNIFIGYDPRESAAYYTLAHSIWSQASSPVSITPLILNQLPLWRERDPLQSTDFTYSRFLVPALSGYEGWSLFMDCDMLVRGDITQLFRLADPRFAVMVVKHPEYNPSSTEKFLGNIQTTYAKKNWSSVMLFQNGRCRSLSPSAVNAQTGAHLHQFKWVDESEIGELPPEWNHLVGEQSPDPNARIAHFTIGGPYFREYSECEFSKEWVDCNESMLNVES